MTPHVKVLHRCSGFANCVTPDRNGQRLFRQFETICSGVGVIWPPERLFKTGGHVPRAPEDENETTDFT